MRFIFTAPYGIRAATEKIESKSSDPPTRSDSDDLEHFPSTTCYNLDELFGDLLQFSVNHLRIGGRLVCWAPFYREDYHDDKVPTHPCLQLITNCEQILSCYTSRRLLTYEKISNDNNLNIETKTTTVNDLTTTTTTTKNSNSMDFREKYFNHAEVSRKERRIATAKLKKIGIEEAIKRGKTIDENGKVINK